MHLWRRLGIIQVNLASALALHKRSINSLWQILDFCKFLRWEFIEPTNK